MTPRGGILIRVFCKSEICATVVLDVRSRYMRPAEFTFPAKSARRRAIPIGLARAIKTQRQIFDDATF
jgi:predicted homoserine dehydrogenase-like protein